MPGGILHNMKSERQGQYILKTDSYVQRKSYQTTQQIGFALALKKSDRNNQVLNLLSAPDYGNTISINGKNTSHLLLLSIFQSRINEKCEPIALGLGNTQSLTLIDNPFDHLLDCDLCEVFSTGHLGHAETF